MEKYSSQSPSEASAQVELHMPYGSVHERQQSQERQAEVVAENIGGLAVGAELEEGNSVEFTPKSYGQPVIYSVEQKTILIDAPDYLAAKFFGGEESPDGIDVVGEVPELRFSPADIDVVAQELTEGVTEFVFGEIRETELGTEQKGMKISVVKSSKGGVYYRLDSDKQKLEKSLLDLGESDKSAENLNSNFDEVDSTARLKLFKHYGDIEQVQRRKEEILGVTFDDEGRMFLPSASTLVEFAANNPRCALEPIADASIDDESYVRTIAEKGRLPVGLGNAFYYDHDIGGDHASTIDGAEDGSVNVMQKFMQPFAKSALESPPENSRLAEVLIGALEAQGLVDIEDINRANIRPAVVLDQVTAMLDNDIYRIANAVQGELIAPPFATKLIWGAIEVCGIQKETGFESPQQVNEWIMNTYLTKVAGQ